MNSLRSRKNPTGANEYRIVLCPGHFQQVQGNVRRHFHETFPATWLLAEGGGRRQVWKIVTMATSLLVQPGSAVLPLEYSFILPPSAAAWAMDRFVPSSRQPQHWSRNYHGSQERRRSMGRRRGSPDSQEKDVSSYRQGVTLRAEDLLVNSESKLGSGNRISPSNHITPRPGDGRRALVGGSATELPSQNSRPPALRRASEGGTRRKSSSSSNAADDPTSSDPSSSCTTTSSSSSSESGCNADSETCNYCRLSESSDGRESSSSTEGGDRSSSSPSPPQHKLINNGDCRRLTRALSEECHPPSRPVRRTSPGEYLRHKRDQMDRLRHGHRRSQYAFQRCDSDPRLGPNRRTHHRGLEEGRTLTFASPTRNRIRKTGRRSEEEVVLMSPSEVERLQEMAITRTSNPELDRPRRPSRPMIERRSRSKERHSTSGTGAVLWSSTGGATIADDSMPFLASSARRSSFRCAVCDCDIPFTNCVLCNAEAKGAGTEQEEEGHREGQEPSEELVLELDGEPVVRSTAQEEEEAELEEFYDRPTPSVDPPLRLPDAPPPPTTDERRVQWTSSGGGQVHHKSFNHQEEHLAGRRRSSLRKYNSEPVPETEEMQYLYHSGDSASSHDQQQKAESSSSGKSESRAGYHVAKDSPRRESPQQKDAMGSCHYCGKTAEGKEEEDRSGRPDDQEDLKLQRKGSTSPAYLRPQFEFEPEIIHKANPLVDEADVDVLPSAVGVFRRLSEEEFISTLNIHEAARKGDLHVVKLLTKKDPKQMETVDERGWTPIHLAAAHGHTEVVKYLAMEGAHLAALDPSSYTAIHLAAMNGHNSCLEVLLPLGVDVDSVTSEGFTALHLAVMNCHLECIQTLLQWGSSLDKRDALGRGINDMVEEYNLQDVAALLRRFHKQLHNFKHMLDIMNREGKNTSEMPREFMDILASIAEESGTD